MKKQNWWVVITTLVLIAGVFWYYSKNEKVPEEEVIKIGAILPLTENAAGLGNSTKEGIELAIFEFNKTNKIKVVCDFYDSKGKPSEGVSITNRAVLENPKFIYTIVSGVAMAILPITEKSNTPLIGAVGALNFTKEGKISIRNYVEPDVIGKTIVGLSVDTLKTNRLGIFYSNNEYGLSIKKAFQNEIGQRKAELIFEESFEDNKLEYKNIILKALVNKNIETVYIAGVGKSLGTLLKQLREAGYKGNVVGDLVFPYPDVISAAGEYSKGVYYLDFDMDEKKDAHFFDIYKMRFGHKPTNFSAIAYDAVKIALDNWNPSLIKNLESHKEFDGIFGKIKFENKNFVYPLKLKIYE